MENLPIFFNNGNCIRRNLMYGLFFCYVWMLEKQVLVWDIFKKIAERYELHGLESCAFLHAREYLYLLIFCECITFFQS